MDCKPTIDLLRIGRLVLKRNRIRQSFIAAALILINLVTAAQPAKKEMAHPLYTRAQEHFAAFRYDSSMYYYEKVLDEFKRSGNKWGIAAALKGMGDIWIYRKNYDAAIPLLEDAIKIWEPLNDDKYIAMTRTSLGAAYMYRGKHAVSRTLLRQAIQTFIKLNDKNALLTAYLNLGTNDSQEGNYPLAIESYLASLKMAEALGNKKMMVYNYLNLGNVNVQLNEPERALYNLKKSLSIAEEIGEKVGIGTAYQNIALVLKNQKKFSEARDHLQRAVAVFKELKDHQSLQVAQMTMGRIYEAEGDYKNALQYYLETNGMTGNATIPWHRAGIYQYIANMYNKLQQPLQAKPWAEKALAIAKELNSDAAQADVYGVMSEADSLAGNYDGALYNYKQHIFYKEKIFNEKNIKKTATLELQYASEKKADSVKFVNEQHQLSLQKEMQLAALRHEYEAKQASAKSEEERLKLKQEEVLKRQSIESDYKLSQLKSQREIDTRNKQIELNNLALSNARRTRAALIACAVLLFIIGGLLFYQNQNRRRTNITLMRLNGELDDANKIKTKFFGILSHDLRSPVINLINFLHLQKEMPELINEEKKEQFQKELTSAAEGLLDNMEAMLLWSKSQMERFEPRFKRIPVDSLFGDLKKVLPARTNIRFTFENPGQLEVCSDEDYLRSILYNLTANAVKALNNTPFPEITWKAQQKGNEVALIVTDNGPGIHKEQMDALYNEEAVVGTKHGLGLHLIRDLARSIGCNILLDSNKSTGTSFSLLLRC